MRYVKLPPACTGLAVSFPGIVSEMNNFSCVKFIVWDLLLTLEKNKTPSLPSPSFSRSFHVWLCPDTPSEIISGSLQFCFHHIITKRATEAWENKSEQVAMCAKVQRVGFTYGGIFHMLVIQNAVCWSN